ncbi:unnamed protein product [Heterosigma akashiwo]|mmetsp:Transcript_5712/g.7700  ORF Transcript_5712/g.7700 Transcript_5712/m.7700 type:complete len:254 (-) Transcript_5712:144-905(-)
MKFHDNHSTVVEKLLGSSRHLGQALGRSTTEERQLAHVISDLVQHTGLNVESNAVNARGLAVLAGVVLDDRVSPQLEALSLHVEVNSLSVLLISIINHIKGSLVDSQGVSDVNEPVLKVAQEIRARGSLHTTALVVATHDDVLHAKVVHSILKHRKERGIRGDSLVSNVSVHEKVTRVRLGDELSRHAGVGAPNPQITRSLAGGELGEVVRIGSLNAGCPVLVLSEQLVKVRAVLSKQGGLGAGASRAGASTL